MGCVVLGGTLEVRRLSFPNHGALDFPFREFSPVVPTKG